MVRDSLHQNDAHSLTLTSGLSDQGSNTKHQPNQHKVSHAHAHELSTLGKQSGEKRKLHHCSTTVQYGYPALAEGYLSNVVTMEWMGLGACGRMHWR